MTQENKIRVLITEKESFRFKVLAKMLHPYSHISLVGYSSNRDDLFATLRESPVDVLLFDISMFRNESADVIASLNSEFPRLKVILCTDAHLGYYFRLSVGNCGVSAHIPKNSDAPELAALVTDVFADNPDNKMINIA